MLRFVRNGLLLLLLLSGTKIFAGDFNGVVTKLDVIVSPASNALVEVREGSKPTVSMRTNVDGSYHFQLNKSQSYIVKISYKTFADTLFTFKTDKSGKPTAPQNMVVKLKRHGIYLTGSVRSMGEFFPIKEAVVVLKNVMTREEKRVMTGADGVYNFKLEYESNYRLSVDKRSNGIFNRYRDTSLYLSTIGLDQPMEYWLNLRLEEDKQKTTEGIEGYDPMRVNSTIKPSVDVLNKTYKSTTPNYLEGTEVKPRVVPQSSQEVKIDTARKSASAVFDEIKKDSTVVAIPVKTLPTTKPVEQKPTKAVAAKVDSSAIVAAKQKQQEEELAKETAKKAEQERLSKELAKNELLKAKEEAKKKEEEALAKANSENKNVIKGAEPIKETAKKTEPVNTKAISRDSIHAAKEQAKLAAIKAVEAKAAREKAYKDSVLVAEWIKERRAEDAKKAQEEMLAKAKAAQKDSLKAAKQIKKDVPVKAAPVQTKSSKSDSIQRAKEAAKQAEEDRILKEKTAQKMAEELAAKSKAEKKDTAKTAAAKKDKTVIVEEPAKKPTKPEPAKPEKAAVAKEEPTTTKKEKTKAEPKPAKQEPTKTEVSTRSLADIKTDIKAAEKNLDEISKQEKEILKAAAYEKKQKEKNKGLDVVIIGDGPKITPAQIAAQKMAATQKLEDLKAELERVKSEKK